MLLHFGDLHCPRTAAATLLKITRRKAGSNPSLKHKLTAPNDDSAFSSVGVINLLHAFDRIKIADHVSRAEALAGCHLLPVQFLDHAHVAALMAPGFGNLGRIERHPSYPRARLSGHPDLLGSNHSL